MAADTAIGSTISGASVSITSGNGDIAITGSNVLADAGIAVRAAGDVTIDAATSTAEESSSSSVKKSGLSFGGGGLFAGVAKTKTQSEVSASTSTGSVLASAAGPITIEAGRVLTVEGSTIATRGDVTLTGATVDITAATETLDSLSKTKSSSTGLSLKLYENISGAAGSVAGLGDRIGEGASGGAAQTGITAASEAVRTVRSVMTAATNAVGVSASLGTSKSSTTSETHQTSAVGSTIAGDTVAIIARDGDLIATGATIRGATSVDLIASRDVILQSAQDSANSTSSNKSSGFSAGLNLGVGLTGVATATGSVGVSASKGNSQSTSVTQVNTVVDGGEHLTIISGRDTTLQGANASATNVTVDAGRDLTIASVQDTSSGSSSSKGISLGVSASTSSDTLETSTGGNIGLSGSKGSNSAAVVTDQTSLIAIGGTLNATVDGTTKLTGGVLAAIDSDGKDSGQLSLETNKLIVTNIEDSARSKNVSLGITSDLNNPLKAGEAGKGNLPVVDGSYQSSSFAQTTKGTLGEGSVTIHDAAGSTDLASVNRDLEQAQVVTKDKQSGFTAYADAGAASELAKGLPTIRDAVGKLVETVSSTQSAVVPYPAPSEVVPADEALPAPTEATTAFGSTTAVREEVLGVRADLAELKNANPAAVAAAKGALTQGIPDPLSSELTVLVVPGIGGIPDAQVDPTMTLAGAINTWAYFSENALPSLPTWLKTYYFADAGGIDSAVAKMDRETRGNSMMLAGTAAALQATGDPVMAEAAKRLNGVLLDRWNNGEKQAAEFADAQVNELLRAANPSWDFIQGSKNIALGQATTRDVIAVGGPIALGLAGKTIEATATAVNAARAARATDSAALTIEAEIGSATVAERLPSRNGSRTVLNQGQTPTCGPTSVCMVLDTMGQSADLSSVIAQSQVGTNGISMTRVASLLRDGGVDAAFKAGVTIDELALSTAKGSPAIVAVRTEAGGHAIVVDGVTTRQGVPVVAIRDPHGTQYFEAVSTFVQRFTGQAVVVR